MNTFEIELSSRDKKSSECELSVQIFISQRISNGETIILNTLSPRLPRWLLNDAFRKRSPGVDVSNPFQDQQLSRVPWTLSGAMETGMLCGLI